MLPFISERRDALATGALAFVNDTRDLFDADPLEELRPGRRGDPWCCPISQSLRDVAGEVCTSRHSVRNAEGDVVAELSREASRFTAEFDQGHYPHLLAP